MRQLSSTYPAHESQSPTKISRRDLLQAGAAFAFVGPALAGVSQAQGPARGTNRHLFAYVGTGSSPGASEASRDVSNGICLFQMDLMTGGLEKRELFSPGSNASWLAFDPSRTHLYAANETQNFQGTHSGSVTAFSVNGSDGSLALLNTVASGGAGPAHLSVHPSGKYVFTANYEGGTIAALPVQSNGELGSATDVKTMDGAVGASHATDAPSGSFAVSGHDGHHPHMVQADAAGRFVLSVDLGMDRISIWKFDESTGSFSANDRAGIQLPTGDGPRHFVFHPNGRWLYSLQEEASTVVVFDYDHRAGELKVRQTLSSLPKGFAGTSFASEILLSPDSRFIYAANRLHDTIAHFSVGQRGELTLIGETWTRGDYPRSFRFDPTGKFLYCCNERSDAVTNFSVNRKTGELTFMGQYTPVRTPSVIVFLD